MMDRLLYFLVLLILLLGSCSTTKNIPENKYLLKSIKVTHNTRNATSDLEDFVRQQPNNKLRLMIYNAVGTDSSKSVARFIQKKLGQPPVIYSAGQTMQSAQQLQKDLSNQGYLNAVVDTILKPKGKKMDVVYNIDAGTPYKIKSYTYQIQDTTMARIMNVVMDKYFIDKEIQPGDFYDMKLLEAERDRVTSVMRNVGYADFSKEYVYFRADTTLGTHQVDLFLDIYPARDSTGYKRFKMDKITVVSGFNMSEMPDESTGRRRRFFRNADTTQYKGITIIRGKNNFLRNSTIARNNYMRQGSYYSDYMLNHTYEAYSKMGAVSQVNISTKPSKVDSTKLMDATIILVPAKANWFRAALDGTNSAGDIGIAPSVSYQQQNLFNGSELLGIKLKGAYEFIPGDNSSTTFGENYYEYGADVNITFPLFVFPFLKRSWKERPSASTDFSVGINNQSRPEYRRQFFHFTAKYIWATERNQWSHNLDLVDVNYVRMPWVSDAFREEYLVGPNSNPLLRESYKDQLIERTAYSAVITNGKRINQLSATSTIRFGVEIAGLLPRLATIGKRAPRNADGTKEPKEILGVAYAEYAKGNIDFSQTFHLSKRHSIAYRIGTGVAQPFGNSNILPFERRFFGGGANGVRGWNTRTLGPGAFKPKKGEANFVLQTGDIELIMSIEDRHKVTSLVELAAFIDAGNIWTIKNYEGQEGGLFKFNTFYKEIALSYGAGIRFDLGFLLLRLDLGVKAYDPSRDEGHRFVSPNFSRMAWHFAIGYPF